eukprot:1732854-Pleurochrysis_carterae.AAC.1
MAVGASRHDHLRERSSLPRGAHACGTKRACGWRNHNACTTAKVNCKLNMVCVQIVHLECEHKGPLPVL